jgi:hypothetical protein
MAWDYEEAENELPQSLQDGTNHEKEVHIHRANLYTFDLKHPRSLHHFPSIQPQHGLKQ